MRLMTWIAFILPVVAPAASATGAGWDGAGRAMPSCHQAFAVPVDVAEDNDVDTSCRWVTRDEEQGESTFWVVKDKPAASVGNIDGTETLLRWSYVDGVPYPWRSRSPATPEHQLSPTVDRCANCHSEQTLIIRPRTPVHSPGLMKRPGAMKRILKCLFTCSRT